MEERPEQHRPRQSGQQPNLFDYVPKSVWREVYNGRWGELTGIQKAEFILEVVFAIGFFGGLVCYPLLRDGSFVGLIAICCTVAGVLLLFFFLLSRSIR